MIGLGTNHSTATLPVAAAKERQSRAKNDVDLGGRPTVVTPEVVRKLEQAFAIDATVTEACSYAGISRDTFYRWREQNPELSDKLESLREQPVLAMRQAAIKLGTAAYTTSMDYLSRKRPDEFGNRSKVEHAGVIATTPVPMTEAARRVALEYEEKLRAAIVEDGKKKP